MEQNKLYLEWKEKYNSAKSNMLNRNNNIGILIEVAAQHPLVEGKYPNEEFEKRLLYAIRLYNDLKAKDEVVKIYVPGSKHKNNGVVDNISLSLAGKVFLVNMGIPVEDIFADEMNLKYKREDGVYNSSDECFVSSKIFEDFNFRDLHCVCSSAQLHRKALNYIDLGYIPYMHSVSCDDMYHNYVDEVFEDIPRVVERECLSEEKLVELRRKRESRIPQE